MTQKTQFVDSARALLGERGWTQDPDLVDAWLTDWRGQYTGRALGLASPASTDEVSQLVNLCKEHHVPIVPQGGNSGMCGGATPDESGTAILLSLRRMNSVRKFSPEERQITCEAGLVLQDLHQLADAEQLRFPLTLGGKGSATIGGLISTNAGGTQVLRHGSMRAQVLGLEAVLADGSIFDTLTPLKKDNRGFDLKQVLIGSEGTLGIVTAATLQLRPAIADRAVLWAGVNSIGDARKLFLHAQSTVADALEGFEVIPKSSLMAVLQYLPNARAPLALHREWNVLIELVADNGSAEALPKFAEDFLSEGFEAGLLEDATLAANEAQAEEMWLLRDSISAAEKTRGPAMKHDISVPVSAMADFIDHTIPRLEAKFPGTKATAFGHLGDGNVHFHAIAPVGVTPGEWERKQGKIISQFVHDEVTVWGGSISAEHGIGQMKRDELARLGDPAQLAMMRAIKKALDPQNILNPGKLIDPEG